VGGGEVTCIIGFVCPETKKVYIGGDSAGIAGYSLQIRADEKVFKNGPFLMGFTTSFRMGNLLRYSLSPPTREEGIDDMAFMVKNFIPAVRTCLKDGGWMAKKEEREEGGSFLVGYRGQLYYVDYDFQVGKLADNIASVGVGSEIALGAMYALGLGTLTAKERIEAALGITAKLNAGVHPPFVIEEL
jgi:ATP-dependent protease HslVU (ClpYQ) peptidase subunit